VHLNSARFLAGWVEWAPWATISEHRCGTLLLPPVVRAFFPFARISECDGGRSDEGRGVDSRRVLQSLRFKAVRFCFETSHTGTEASGEHWRKRLLRRENMLTSPLHIIWALPFPSRKLPRQPTDRRQGDGQALHRVRLGRRGS
jgi:hypothetical protein